MIARMEQVEIVCLRSLLPEVVSFIQEQGSLHVEEVPLVVENAPDFLHRVHMNDRQREELAQLEELERVLKESVPLLTVALDPETIAASTRSKANRPPAEWARDTRQSCQELRGLSRRRVKIQDNIEVLSHYRHILQTLEPVLSRQQVLLGKGARAMVLEGDAVNAVETLKRRFAGEVGPDCAFYSERSGRKSLVGFVTYPEERARDIANILHEEGIVPVDTPDSSLHGATVGEMLQRVKDAIAEQHANLVRLQDELDVFSRARGPELQAGSLIVNDQLTQLRSYAHFAQSEMLGVLLGWVPQESIHAFTEKINRRFEGNVAVKAVECEQVDRRHIPTLLKNLPILKPFEVLLSLFKPPTYGSYDPTLLVAVSFILFYGFIVGDVVYGIAVLAFAGFLRKKWGHIDAVKSASTVGFYMGVSAIVFGVLFGEYAGSLGETYLGIHSLWFHRGHESGRLLLYAILFGLVHVPLGLILGVWEDYRHHHTKHAMEKLGLLLGGVALGAFVAGSLGVFPFNQPLFNYVSLGLFVLSVVLLFKGMGAMGFIGVLEILSLAGNVLSYARLMALGLAGIALAETANQVGASLPVYIGIPVALVIHLLNIGIGMFSPTLHSLRLNYVEFLSKFYVPEGKLYKPFRKEAIW